MEYFCELSIVLPCLNEEKTIGICIEKIKRIFKERNIDGEIIVSDNGSTDKSIEIAKLLGAKVVYQSERGYGNALRKGIEESRGKYIIMGDADNTYDFLEIPKFLEALKGGYDLVIGSRFKGKILKGAMTFSHKYIGNPILTGMLKLFFGGNISDAHCGLRGFTREAYLKMNLHTTGMEFASEMIIHALKKKMKIKEIPISYYPRLGESKLSRFRDAWRHIRFMLLYAPDYLFLVPGLLLFLPNLLITVRLLFGPIFLFGRAWDIHVMVFSGMFTLLGWQIINLYISAKVFALIIGLEESKWLKKISVILKLENSLLFGVVLIMIGLVVIGNIFYMWSKTNFGELAQVKPALFALLLMVMGFQTFFSSFLTSMLGIKYR